MSKLTRDDVLKLAQLARLNLSEAEVDEFTKEFGDLLTYVEQLQAVDTEGLEPTNQVSGNVNVMREDGIRDYGYEPKQLLANVPSLEDGHIRVKRMVA